ncbi:CRISPR-associated endonuclease Cas2 [Halobellus sp. Atlit-31R]|nr:CRISPR-associated endonuclease Cas2 [Halobellus sp. Atlit-31R]
MSETRRYVVAYDITEDSLRRRIRAACRAYGGRRQYSLFEMYLSERERAELITDLTDLLAQRDEYASVKVYSVGPPDRDATLGETPAENPENVV